MAEIKPMALIESMKKKVCEHSDVYFRTNHERAECGSDQGERAIRESISGSTSYSRRDERAEDSTGGGVQGSAQVRQFVRLRYAQAQ